GKETRGQECRARGQPLKDLVESGKEQRERSADRAPDAGWLVMAVRLEQQGRKRRRQCERHHRRDDGRSRDRERELPVELTRDAGDEGGRDEDRAEDER